MSNMNVILIMCDDLGYGDTGFNGNPVIRTPHLDQMAKEGAVFTRFYCGGPVCSPTRGTCLTGRHYYRYGITSANNGRLPTQEVTLPKVLKAAGYSTGHFGKWHLGTLTKEIRDGRRGGPQKTQYYSPPWLHGYDTCFSTEVQVPLWDPMVDQTFPSRYWHADGTFATDNLEGDDSRVIMDRVLPFIQQSAASGTPFFATVWFHAPHSEVRAGDAYRKLYGNYTENEQHYYGCITAMDEQVGRLNETIKRLGIEDQTLIWFCSDNGPEVRKGRSCGSTGGLRGRKRSLFNGGIEVPALIKWPKWIRSGTVLEAPCSTLDFLPTIMDELGLSMPDERPIDGISLLPCFSGEQSDRPKPIPLRFVRPKDRMHGSPTFGLIINDYKLLTNFSDNGADDMVYNLVADPFEQNNLIGEQIEFMEAGKSYLRQLLQSFERSHLGGDYADPDYRPVEAYVANEQGWPDD